MCAGVRMGILYCDMGIFSRSARFHHRHERERNDLVFAFGVGPHVRMGLGPQRPQLRSLASLRAILNCPSLQTMGRDESCGTIVFQAASSGGRGHSFAVRCHKTETLTNRPRRRSPRHPIPPRRNVYDARRFNRVCEHTRTTSPVSRGLGCFFHSPDSALGGL